MSNWAVGRWDVEVFGPNGAFPTWWEIASDGESYHGRFVGEVGSARPIKSIEIHEDTLRFSLPPQYEGRQTDLTFVGTFADGRMSGHTDDGNGREMTWEAVRAPELAFDHEPTWGETIELFNGQDLDNWHARSTHMPFHWVVEDGLMVNKAVGSDIVTNDRFMSFRLHAEYRYPPNSNSGIYLRGRYEVQILDDYGKEPSVGSSGAIYGYFTPRVNAVNPADEWNVAIITLLGRKVTIELNGQVVIEKAEIPGITGGALDSDEGVPGPLFLQGDHGPVQFRRLSLTPVVESAT